MGAASAPNASKSVGSDLASVLPKDGVPWYKRGHIVRLHFVILSLLMFSSSNGYDGSLMNGLQALPSWQSFMNRPRGAWLGFINAIYWLGAGISAPIAAALANRFGRKIPIYAGYIFLVLGTVLQTAANTETEFAVARFFLGCCSAFYGNVVPLLINEISYPTHRGITSALYNCGWYVGSLVAAWVTYATRDYETSWAWRLPSVLQALLPLVALPGLFIASQSPRWLIAQHRSEEARKVLARDHAGGDLDDPLVNYEMIEIETTLNAEVEAQESTGYMDMTKTPGNRKRLFISVTLAIFSQWSGNGVVSYYLSLVLETVGITSVRDQTLISGCLQVWNLGFAVAAAFLVDRVGRRKLFLTSAATMLTSYIVITGLSGSFASTHNGPTGIAVIPFLFIFFAGYDISLTPLLIAYPCEIWPYNMRGRGLSVTWVVLVAAIFFNTFVNPIALEAIGWKYYFVFVAVLIAYGLTAFFYYPETRGRSLEQMAYLFDGDDAGLPSSRETAERSTSISAERRASHVKEKDDMEKSSSFVEERV